MEGPAPDLVVLAPDVSDSSPEADGTLWLLVTVHNQGDGRSAATTVRYYRSTDATITTSDSEVGTDAVGEAFHRGDQPRVDQPDGAVDGENLLLRGVRGRGDGGIRHDEQLLGIRVRRSIGVQDNPDLAPPHVGYTPRDGLWTINRIERASYRPHVVCDSRCINSCVPATIE